MVNILKSFFMIVAVATIASGATSAAWTDSATVGGNVFSTGYIDITTARPNAFFLASGLYPGWSEERSLVVINNGTIDFEYDIAVAMTAGDAVLYNSSDFVLKIGTTSGGDDLYSGPVSDFDGLDSVRELSAKSSEGLFFNVSLLDGAGNGLQSKTATISFNFIADQI